MFWRRRVIDCLMHDMSWKTYSRPLFLFLLGKFFCGLDIEQTLAQLPLVVVISPIKTRRVAQL